MTSNSLRNLVAALAALALTAVTAAAQPKPTAVSVVAIGASNTWGWGVGGRNAYPERLEDLLKADGIDARVVNAGVVLDTTAGMLRRLDAAVPDGTDVVILQPGGNDKRFFRSDEQRAANIEAMVLRLKARNIAVIVYDPVFPPEAYQWDRIHLTADAHARIAAELLPQVTKIVRPKDVKPKQAPKRR
jgi:acyl-CoA thioesterase-1